MSVPNAFACIILSYSDEFSKGGVSQHTPFSRMQQLAKDVESVRTFLAAHAKSAAGGDESVKANMCNSLLAKIRGATIDLESASDIIDKIQGAIWSQEQKRALQSAVTSRIQAPAATSGLSRNVTQTLHHFQKYISHDLLQALQRKDLAV